MTTAILGCEAMAAARSLIGSATEWLGPLREYAVSAEGAPTAELARRWATSGAMALTGPVETPLVCPIGILRRLDAIGDTLRGTTAAGGNPVVVAPLELLVERAALAGLERRGSVSCGGRAQLLRSIDGWIGVTLARPEDFDALPAWINQLTTDGASGNDDPWQMIASVVSSCSAQAVVSAGQLVGIPVAALGEVKPGSWPLVATKIPGDGSPSGIAGSLVVDLSSLWAGPLCSRLLAAGGATVIKVESRGRPDGARNGQREFFDLMNASFQSLVLDLSSSGDRARLVELLKTADVVIEGSRPRALAQWGIEPREVMARGRTRAWVSITGYGRRGEARNRVAFGDDAAVAGGMVAWHRGEPNFVVDSVADPVTGLTAATAVATAMRSPGKWLLDVSLAGAAAWLAGVEPADRGWLSCSDRPDLQVMAPAPPRIGPPAAQLGVQSGAVLAERPRGRR